MNRLSACLITLNEEHNLPRALASLAGIADEIVVVDSGSTDRTEQIAREHGAVFYSRAWTNYADQKNFAAARAQNEWVLSLDADEDYRRDAAQFSGIIHESLKFEGLPGRLNGDLLHYTVRSFAEHESNVERYTALAARQMFEAGKRSWRGAMWLATPWSWFQNFFLRGGFLDGYRGALIAQMAARSVRLKYAKLGKLIEAGQNKPGVGA